MNYDEKHNHFSAALNNSGIYGGANFHRHASAGIAKINKLASEIASAITAQFLYNLSVNHACLKEKNKSAHLDDAIKNGLVSTISTYLGFSLEDTQELCAALAEDVNHHSLAASIRAFKKAA